MNWSKHVIYAIVCVQLGLAQSVQSPAASEKTDSVEAEISARLLHAKRIYVDSFGDDPINRTLQSMVIDSLRLSRRFIITENREKADLILKGSALENESRQIHSVGSSTGVAGGMAAFGRAMRTDDSQTSVESVSEAKLAARLVSPDGDVIWSATEESKGGKYKGAAADVADLVVKALLRELERLRMTGAH